MPNALTSLRDLAWGARSSIRGSLARIVGFLILKHHPHRKREMGLMSCHSAAANTLAAAWEGRPMRFLGDGLFPAFGAGPQDIHSHFSVQSGPQTSSLSQAVPLSSARPKTGSFIVAQAGGGTGPNVFKDPGITDPSNPNAAINLFRPAYPGEAGLRNGLDRALSTLTRASRKAGRLRKVSS